MKFKHKLLNVTVIALTVLFLGYILVHVLVGVSDTFKEAHDICFKYLLHIYLAYSIYVLVNLWQLTHRTHDCSLTGKKALDWLAFPAILIMFTIAFTVLSRPYVLMINKYIGTPRLIHYQGKIEAKFITKKRVGRDANKTTLYNFIIQLSELDKDRNTDRIQWMVNQVDYQNFEIGDDFEIKLMRGSLGVTFQEKLIRSPGYSKYCLSSEEIKDGIKLESKPCQI